MSEDRKNQKKQTEVLGALNDAFNGEVSEQLEKRLENRLNGFKQDLKEHPYVRSQGIGGYFIWHRAKQYFRPFLRPSLLAGLGLACVAIVVFFPFGKSAPTWAEVVDNFQKVDSFCATYYIKDSVWSSPSHVELWVGYGDRFRILSGRTVAFGKAIELLKVYDLENRAEGAPDPATLKLLRAYREFYDDFDESRVDKLKAILEAYPDVEIVDTTSLVHPDPVFSKDLIVFDAKSDRVSIRLWALRESRLPVRILYRGDAGWQWDEIFTYSKVQPEKFFDPDAFAAELKKPDAREMDLMYLYMEDPAESSTPTPEI